jgi:thymidylate synthase
MIIKAFMACFQCRYSNSSSNKYGFAADGGIPWECPVDMKYFAEQTQMGKNPAVVMGRKTYESIGKPLKNRINIVLSSGSAIKECVVVSNIWEAIWSAVDMGVSHLYVIGGLSVYENFLDTGMISEFHITFIHDYQSPSICDVFADKIVNKIQHEYQASPRNYLTHGATRDVGVLIYEPISTRGFDHEFLELCQKLLKTPLSPNRTEFRTHTGTPASFSVSLRGGTFPASTLRRQYINGIFWELMWMISGRTDLQYLHDHGVHVWDANCTTEALARTGNTVATTSDIGPGYGFQWRHFGGTFGVEEVGGFDQVAEVVRLLREDPTSRRIMLSGWCPPDVLHDAALPPCHVLYQWTVIENKLNCAVFQRSSDVALALNWNVVAAALFTHILAHHTGLTAGELMFSIGCPHIYKNHVEQVGEMLKRTIRSSPVLLWKPNTVRDDISEYTRDDFAIINYRPDKSIDMGQMAV